MAVRHLAAARSSNHRGEKMSQKQVDAVVDYIHKFSPIPTARVSSAQASGRAKRYAYFGAVRYHVHVTRLGGLVNSAMERASSDRRSERLAQMDARVLCDQEGRLLLQQIGSLRPQDVTKVLKFILFKDLGKAQWLMQKHPLAVAEALAEGQNAVIS